MSEVCDRRHSLYEEDYVILGSRTAAVNLVQEAVCKMETLKVLLSLFITLNKGKSMCVCESE